MASEPGPDPVVSPADLLNARILVVDDQAANVALLEQMLQGAGYVGVMSTRDPRQVVELHQAHRYDLILLDLQMPGLDGFQVMDALKVIEPVGYLPVLVITAQPALKLRALRAGARDFVSKPFDLAEVLMRVHNMLEVRLLHQQAVAYSEALERTVHEVEASREQIRLQSEEVRRLYDDLVKEHELSMTLAAQPGTMVGVEKDERLAAPILRSLRMRHPWLQLNLLTAFAAGTVVFLFRGTIDRLLILAMFIPVLAGQSANTGCQALAVTLRGVLLGELKAGRERALIGKEALLGLMNGAMVGAVAALVMYAIASGEHLATAPRLSLVVFLAMTGSCFISGICGAVVPLALRKCGADPAAASSIFLTTATDMVSVWLLLGLATILVR